MRRLAASIVTLLILATGLIAAPPASAARCTTERSHVATWYFGDGVIGSAKATYQRCGKHGNGISQPIDFMYQCSIIGDPAGMYYNITFYLSAWDRNESRQMWPRTVTCPRHGGTIAIAGVPARGIPRLERDQQPRFGGQATLHKRGPDRKETSSASLL